MAGVEMGGDKPPQRSPENPGRPLERASPADLFSSIDGALDGAADAEAGLEAWLEVHDRLREGPIRGGQSKFPWPTLKPGERPFKDMSLDQLADLIRESADEDGDVRDYMWATDELVARSTEEPDAATGNEGLGPPSGRPS